MTSVVLSHRVRFNPWKHHMLWVKSQIEEFLRNNPASFTANEALINEIKAVNNNQVDIYTGSILPEDLTKTIDNELCQNNIVSREDFQIWMKVPEYRIFTLEDGSKWVLRLGIENDQYIHIHPARNSPHVVRVHGSSWKAALVTKILGLDPENINLNRYNEIRENYLSLSPVKSLINNTRLWKTMHLLWCTYK